MVIAFSHLWFTRWPGHNKQTNKNAVLTHLVQHIHLTDDTEHTSFMHMLTRLLSHTQTPSHPPSHLPSHPPSHLTTHLGCIGPDRSNTRHAYRCTLTPISRSQQQCPSLDSHCTATQGTQWSSSTCREPPSRHPTRRSPVGTCLPVRTSEAG